MAHVEITEYHGHRRIYVRRVFWLEMRPKRMDHKGENNPKAKLTADQVKEIRRRSAAGESERTLADDFGVHHRTIHDIRSERTWANA